MPDSYVLDASVIIRWFLPEQDQDEHAHRLHGPVLAGDIIAVAPRNLVYEFCGAIAKAFRIGRKPSSEAIEVFHAFLELPIRYVESDSLIEGAILLSFLHGKSFYDMCYFSAGEHEKIRVCTADERSVAGVGSGFPPHVLLRNLV